MSDVVIATSQQDALAADRVVRHHAELAGTLSHLVERVVAASSTTDSSAAATARTRLVGWCRSELLPHAAAEEGTLYAAARDLDPTRLLVAAMTDEHQVIIGLVAEVDSARDPIGAYAINSKPFNVAVIEFFAVFGYVALKLDCEPAPLILGFVLGPMMEENLRRALLISRGDPRVFVQEPISLAFLVAAAGLLIVLAAPAIRRKREEALQE